MRLHDPCLLAALNALKFMFDLTQKCVVVIHFHTPLPPTIRSEIPQYFRLQQPVQNPISDNTNVLWNSPSLGKKLKLQL